MLSKKFSKSDLVEKFDIKNKSSIVIISNRFFFASLFLASQHLSAEAPSVSISIANDSVKHGVSLSNEKLTLGLSYDQNLSDHFFIGAGINAHQTSGENKRQGWSHLYGGLFIPIRKEMTFSLSLIRYAFDADFLASWDYNQLRADLSLPHSFGISYSYSDSYYGRGDESQRIELSWFHHFDEQYTFNTLIGLTKSNWNVYFDDFSDSEISITRHFERSRLNIGYHYVEDQAELVHGLENTEPRFTLTYEWDLY